MRRWQTWFFRPTVQVLMWVVGLGLLGWMLVTSGAGRATRVQVERPAPVITRPAGTSEPPEGWTEVAKASMPAVVNIATSRSVGGREGRPFFADPFFRFGRGGPEEAPRRERSLGSGVIITADGYVLTNNHVVDGAQDIRVTLGDRREILAQLVGGDPKTDLAVLKLPLKQLPVVPFSARQAEVAEVVLAIGSPFGLSQTVTMGIVSAVGRANVGIADYEDFIQTDAAINPGNSGGALVNARAELVGINTAIFSQSGGYSGIGFAVPVTMAQQVMEQIVKRGRVTRGYLGLAVQDATPAVTRALGLPETRGVLIADVVPDAPAARAGLKRGDIITAVDGAPVSDAGHFRNLAAATAPGTHIKVTYVRDGREGTAEVAVAEFPERAPTPTASRSAEDTVRVAPAPVRARPPESLGLAFVPVTAEVARRIGIPPQARGVLVTSVVPDSPAAEAGLRPGDVIEEINRRPVRSPQDVARAIEETKEKDLALLVNGGGNAAYVLIEQAG
jgi:serine protease Do